MPNQHKPLSPEEVIKEPLTFWFKCRVTDKRLVTVMKDYYDTEQYGLGQSSIKRLWKRWGLLGTRQQGYTVETVGDLITAAREIYPDRGAETLRQYIEETKGVRIPRETIKAYNRQHEPEKVKARRKRRFVRRFFYAAGVNHVWCMDQHDKWGLHFGLWLHNCIDPFTGWNNWMKVWWTNKQPQLVAAYFLDTLPLLTQSDPGSENYGVANAQTVGRQHLDPSLVGTLQHVFKHWKTNVKSEANWSIFRRDFAPGFENLFQEGVVQGWYDVGNPLQLLTFRWITIPWLQEHLDQWAQQRNSFRPKRHKHKFLPHGPPVHIRTCPQDFEALDFKVGVSPQLISELWHEYAPPNHEVFLLTPPAFNAAANIVYAHMGHPDVDHHSFWSVYRNLL
ncbi:hypothetical protein BDP27DRAFT_1186897, partial [Rhodocollybia butyracea]